jgi:DNA-binding beta-propeller fold protein YncE
MKKIFCFLVCAWITFSTFSQTLTLKWSTDTLLRVPESVYFDSKNNVLYVSNIAGKSNEKDGNGFISKISPEGKIITQQWASGLDAPKGMGLVKNKLYVADLSRVVVLDASSGKILTSIEIDGAQFLNDITVDNEGNVFASDSNTGKIHRIANDKAELYFESTEFKRINGLLALNNGLYIADAGNGVNYILSKDKKLTKYTDTAQGADGIVKVGNDEYIVSSWGGEVYFVKDGKSQKLLDTKDQKLNSADIDFDPKTNTVFVPTFFGNRVMAYTFSNKK